MFTSSYVYLVVFALVLGVALFVASKSRRRRIEFERPRDVSPEERKRKEEELQRLVGSGRKIEAIKCYREFYQTGLKEAKDAVELFEKKNA